MAGWNARSILTFLAELRRRHVIRVALGYAVVAAGIMAIASDFFPALGLPSWTLKLVAILCVLGFPLAVVLAWAYDITPGGPTRTRAPAEPPAASGLEVADAAGPDAADERAIRTLAVLPFANLDPEPGSDYFSDGITEELIGALSRLAGLRVAARTSAFAFKDRQIDVREIGALLGVEGIVEGSVRRGGDRVRIGVQLVSARDGHHRWSDTFEYELSDVLRLQEDVSRAVISALRGHGLEIAPPRATRAPAAGGEAHDLYLRGRQAFNRRTGRDLRAAIAHFERAVAIAPSFALAHSGLADAYALLMEYGLAAPESVLPSARTAAQRALALAPELAETHVSMALVHQCAWEWQAAEAAFDEALALNPGHAAAHHRHALLLAWLGRPRPALEAMRQAHVLDPLSPLVTAGIAWIHYYARDIPEAIRQLGNAHDLDPQFMSAHLLAGMAHLAAHEPRAAIAALETAARLSGDGPTVLPLLGLAYGRAGRDDDAAAVLARVRDMAARAYVPDYYLALAGLGVGDVDAALGALELAVRRGCVQLVYLRADPLWDDMRDHPRFAAVLEAVRLPEPEAASAPSRGGR